MTASLITTLLIAALGVLLVVGASGIGAALVAVARPRELATADGTTLDAEPSIAGRVSWAGLLLAAVLLGAALVLRTIVVGHAPWSTLHEFTIAFAAALVATHLAMSRTAPIDGLSPLTALLGAGLIGFALGLDDAAQPLVPALQQPLLLTVHVGSAVVAYAVSAVAFVAAIGEILQRRLGDAVPVLPPAATARAVGHRSVLIAFPILTIAIALGSVWANLAWRSYWSNDPKELAAAATWLVFGAYLHVAGRRDRWERLAPWLIVLGFAGVLFTYIGAGIFLVGEHSYAAP
jgi:ABC-type transport system involved in cytochrome c biogenesis permease subunit